MAWTRRPHPVELALPALVAVLGLGEIWVPFSSRQGEGSDLTGSVAVLLVALSLAWCRRRPLVPVLAVPVVWGLAALAAPSYVLFYGQMVPLLVGVFMAARYGRGRERWAAAGVAAGTLLLIDLTVPQLQAPGEIAFHWTVTALLGAPAPGCALGEAGPRVDPARGGGRGRRGRAGDAGGARGAHAHRPRAARHRGPLGELDGRAGGCRRSTTRSWSAPASG